MPQNSITRDEILNHLRVSSSNGGAYAEQDGYYYIKPNAQNVSSRLRKEGYSKRMWKAAWLVTHVIKRFPFVRCVMITGTLSKNSSDRSSDLDFMIITEPHRLWIARTMMMLFKKIFLFNSKKFFCINYCITSDSLEILERNIFTATEIATIKCTFNEKLMREFIAGNKWIREFFPNYIINDESLHTAGSRVSSRRSILQAIGELFFPGKLGDRIDRRLMEKTIAYWQRKYPQLNEAERVSRLKSTPSESRVHPGSVQHAILKLYRQKLEQFNLEKFNL